jgi:hypothetical protein
MIDHHTTWWDHPEADGLAERMVQTVKRGLRKYSLKKGHHGDWDLQLPWPPWAIGSASRPLWRPFLYIIFCLEGI